MVTNYEQLVLLCEQELRQKEYNIYYVETLKLRWEELRAWLNERNLETFSESLGKEYLMERYGTYLITKNLTQGQRKGIRAVRMLMSIQKTGTIEFKTPRVEYTFDGPTGKIAEQYLDYCAEVLCLSHRTIDAERLGLYELTHYLDSHNISLSDLNLRIIENFFEFMDYTLSEKHTKATYIRSFLRYLISEGIIPENQLNIVPKINYRKDCILPTTYEIDEIKRMLESVDRTSAIGKRDYIVLLIVSELGWRASDVTSLRFDQIDWDNNTIRFNQSKTDNPVEYPLTPSIGNAIIDYMRFGRPKTDNPRIIVSHRSINLGETPTHATIYAIVKKYMKKAQIKDIENKKCGPHALRHSLATNLLKKNVALPVISTILGHKNTDSTSTYISLDYDKLRQCALPMPPLHSPLYNKEAYNGKI